MLYSNADGCLFIRDLLVWCEQEFPNTGARSCGKLFSWGQFDYENFSSLEWRCSDSGHFISRLCALIDSSLVHDIQMLIYRACVTAFKTVGLLIAQIKLIINFKNNDKVFLVGHTKYITSLNHHWIFKGQYLRFFKIGFHLSVTLICASIKMYLMCNYFVVI